MNKKSACDFLIANEINVAPNTFQRVYRYSSASHRLGKVQAKQKVKNNNSSSNATDEYSNTINELDIADGLE